MARTRAWVVWRFCDGTPGHDRQSAGLLNALAALVPVETHTFDRAGCHISLWHFIQGRWPLAGAPARPDLIIGAGRACQWPMLAARRALGGRAIYLMKPQWPWRWFDLCLIPRHDRVRADTKLIVTDGVLNDIAPAHGDGDTGLILVGGPSAHFLWDEPGLLVQIERIIAGAPDKSWVITDSRRTPTTTRARLQSLIRANVAFVRATDCAADWLPRQLERTDTAWVSCDSVSMLYEALSAGIAVGVLEVPAKRADRINTIAGDLERRGLVRRYGTWLQEGTLRAGEPLREAARCAAMIIERFAGDRGSSSGSS